MAANATVACRSCGRPGTVDAAGRCERTGLPADEGPCGTRIDRYDVIEWIGGGGMGAVYRARHVGLGRFVALKLLRRDHSRDAEAVQRFLREAKATAAIASPHVVGVTDFGVSADGRPFLVMELIEGTDLERVLERRGRLPTDEAVGLALDVLAGLGAAHAAGVVHRDLKPANVLIGAEIVKVVDFGLAKIASGDAEGAALTRTGAMLGTPYAMAPEQASGRQVDARADLWAVGALLYRALSGRRPFEGASAEDVIVRVCTEPAPPLPEVAEPLAGVIARALEREPAARWASAAEMSVALRTAMAAIDRASREASDSTTAPPPDRTDDGDEDDAADPVGPGLRPSLAFESARPRAAWKLPLALLGFVAGAGALIALALVLRPTVAPVRGPAGPPAAMPAYDLVPGEVTVRPDPRPAKPRGPGVRARMLDRSGPVGGVFFTEAVRAAAASLADLRGPEPRRHEIAGTVQPDGRVVLDGIDPVGLRVFGSASFPAFRDRTTRFRLEVVLEPAE